MSGDVAGRVSDEIAFFMEKTFQLSFGYLGGLAALTFASGSSITSDLASALAIPTAIVIPVALLGANSLYMSLSIGTLFAAMKRGRFLMDLSADKSEQWLWERFLRSPSDSFRARAGGQVLWNLDNFYMVPAFLLIATTSVVAAVLALKGVDGWWSGLVVATGILSHVGLFPLVRATVLLEEDLRSVLSLIHI